VKSVVPKYSVFTSNNLESLPEVEEDSKMGDEHVSRGTYRQRLVHHNSGPGLQSMPMPETKSFFSYLFQYLLGDGFHAQDRAHAVVAVSDAGGQPAEQGPAHQPRGVSHGSHF
jgi:hypothetical protein